MIIIVIIMGVLLYAWWPTTKKSKKSGSPPSSSDSSDSNGDTPAPPSDTGESAPAARCAATGGHYSVAFVTDGGYTQYWQCGGCDQDSSADKCIKGCKDNTKNCGACQYTDSYATCFPSATNAATSDCNVIDWSKFHGTITCTTEPSGYVSSEVLKKLKSVTYANA